MAHGLGVHSKKKSQEKENPCETSLTAALSIRLETHNPTTVGGGWVLISMPEKPIQNQCSEFLLPSCSERARRVYWFMGPRSCDRSSPPAPHSRPIHTWPARDGNLIGGWREERGRGRYSLLAACFKIRLPGLPRACLAGQWGTCI